MFIGKIEFLGPPLWPRGSAWLDHCENHVHVFSSEREKRCKCGKTMRVVEESGKKG